MKNGRFSDAQIMGILKQAESGVPVSELCREHGVSSLNQIIEWRDAPKVIRVDTRQALCIEVKDKMGSEDVFEVMHRLFLKH